MNKHRVPSSGARRVPRRLRSVRLESGAGGWRWCWCCARALRVGVALSQGATTRFSTPVRAPTLVASDFFAIDTTKLYRLHLAGNTTRAKHNPTKQAQPAQARLA